MEHRILIMGQNRARFSLINAGFYIEKYWYCIYGSPVHRVYGRCVDGRHVWLGEYKDVKKAREVIQELFQCWKNGSEEYVMPED